MIIYSNGHGEFPKYLHVWGLWFIFQLNGALSNSENIADNGGIKQAYRVSKLLTGFPYLL